MPEPGREPGGRGLHEAAAMVVEAKARGGRELSPRSGDRLRLAALRAEIVRVKTRLAAPGRVDRP